MRDDEGLLVMRAWIRPVAIGVFLSIILSGLFVYGKGYNRYLSEPMTFVLVLSMMIIMGMFTYHPRQLWEVFCSIFSRHKIESHVINQRILGQLALYALIAGILLTLFHILTNLEGLVGRMPLSRNASELRLPLMTLLYGVLAAIGLWAVSGLDKPQPKQVSSSERNQVVMAFGVLLLTVGVLSMLIVGMNQIGGPTDQKPVPVDTLQGLHRGDDMVWRPVSEEQQQKSGRFRGLLPTNKELSSLPLLMSQIVRDKEKVWDHAVKAEPPLRWDLNDNMECIYMTNRGMVPAIRQN